MNSRHSDQDELMAALKAVSQSTLTEGALAGMEEKLMVAFRRHQQPTSVRRNGFRWALLGAAAILLCAIPAAAVWMSALKPTAVQPVARPVLSYHLPAPPLEQPIVYARPAAVTKRAPEVPSEVVTAFLALPYSGPEPDAYEVVRVQMDRSSLAQFGMPVNMELSDEPVDADLLVGNDGVPRAVRFVNQVTSTSQSLQDWRNQ